MKYVQSSKIQVCMINMYDQAKLVVLCLQHIIQNWFKLVPKDCHNACIKLLSLEALLPWVCVFSKLVPSQQTVFWLLLNVSAGVWQLHQESPCHATSTASLQHFCCCQTHMSSKITTGTPHSVCHRAVSWLKLVHYVRVCSLQPAE